MNTFALENEDLCQALRRRVKHYKKEHPALSSQQIAKRFSMSSSTLNRIENEDIRNPTIDQVLKVLRGTGETNDLLSFIEEYYPDIAETYKQVYSHNLDNNKVDSELEQYFEESNTFLIMILAYTDKGTSLEEIEQEMGIKGVRTLRQLIKKNILSVYEGEIRGTDSTVKFSQETTKKLLLNTIDSCAQSETINKMKNFLSIQTTGLSDEGTRLVTNILKKTYEEIDNVFKNEQFKGENKYFVGLVSDFLNYKEV